MGIVSSFSARKLKCASSARLEPENSSSGSSILLRVEIRKLEDHSWNPLKNIFILFCTLHFQMLQKAVFKFRQRFVFYDTFNTHMDCLFCKAIILITCHDSRWRIFQFSRVNHHTQGNLLKGIDKKTGRREGIESIKRFFTYVLFSVTHFLSKEKQNGLKL